MKLARRKPHMMTVRHYGDQVRRQAYVFGHLVVWRDMTPHKRPDWVISHAPTGRRIAFKFGTWPDVSQCASHLDRLGNWLFYVEPARGTQMFTQSARAKIVPTIQRFGGRAAFTVGSRA